MSLNLTTLKIDIDDYETVANKLESDINKESIKTLYSNNNKTIDNFSRL